MKEIGADVAFNYKTKNVRDVLKEEGPINMWVVQTSGWQGKDAEDSWCSYWDNVGGEILEAALDNAAIGACFIVCAVHVFAFQVEQASKVDIVCMSGMWYDLRL